MAKKKIIKKSDLKKLQKKNPSLFIALLIIVILIAAGVFTYIYFIKPRLNNNNVEQGKENNNNNQPKSTSVLEIPEIETETTVDIHFLAMDNKYAGDSIYIKVNDIDILVDAGSRQSSAKSINTYLDQYVTDNTLEYVIATHADQDHIAGFVGTTKEEGVIDHYTINTIIDFVQTNKEIKDTSLVGKYYNKLASCVEKGTKHYTALECYNEENGAKKRYDLSEDTYLEILYNYFYNHTSSDENNYSVCFMITQCTRHFLFTGDLEEKGEEYLVTYNTLPEVELFKVGHHGSPTSTTNKLLEAIKPKICVVSCTAGCDEYTKNKDNQFPSQAFIDRIRPYTKIVYVTNMMVSDDDYAPMNGNIEIKSNKKIEITCSASDKTLFETEWFKENRK